MTSTRLPGLTERREMLAVRLNGTELVTVDNVPVPSLEEPTDAIVAVRLAAICGSDLSAYRGRADRAPGQLLGHEFIGHVFRAGTKADLAEGDLVVSPFSWSDGTCGSCRAGWQSSCAAAGFWGRTPGSGGAQAEYVRVPFASQTLVKIPSDTAIDLLPALLTAGDVLATGHHGVALTGVSSGARLAVIGDGAVGLCSAMAARRAGAAEVVVFGHHAERADLARRLGADSWTASPPEDPRTLASFDGVVECVGTCETIGLAVSLTRDGGCAAFVGVPHGIRSAPIAEMFRRNVALRGGITPARRYMPRLIADILSGSLDPSPVFGLRLPLSAAAHGYAMMHARSAVKVLLECY